MIRRDVQLDNGEPGWLLFSQVEHARLSGVLASRCVSTFRLLRDLDADQKEEVLRAITHHDDGWAEWERQPRLDESGRPLSFRELPLEQSLEISTRSIGVAEGIGPLAAWMVAGHFVALFKKSDRTEHTSEEERWLIEVETKRDQWLSGWQQKAPQQNTVQAADDALLTLQVFDAMSLWLCSVADGSDGGELESYRIGGEGAPLDVLLNFVSKPLPNRLQARQVGICQQHDGNNEPAT